LHWCGLVLLLSHRETTTTRKEIDMTTTGKAVSKLANKKGTVFALVAMTDGFWQVMKLCSNYDGKVRGGIRKTWRVAEKNMNEADARNLYSRRLQGTQA